MAMMAAATEKIGLTSTLSSTFYPPFLLARLLGTLDHLTRGRVGWNLVTSASKDSAQNFGYDELLEHDERYDRADEYLALCRALWDSWEPDAVKLDRDNSIVVKRASVEQRLGREWDPQEIHLVLVSMAGNLDEDDDQFVLSWRH